jgi:hypothetical protein
MKPCFVCLILASTLMLAQSDPSYFNQKHSASASRYAQGLSFAHDIRNSSTGVARADQSLQAQGLSFASPVSYGSGGYSADSIAIADLNGDGNADLVVGNACTTSACPGEGSVGVLLNNGGGTFKTVVTYSSGGQGPNPSYGPSVAIADVNGDGKPDLVVANYCANPCVADGSVGVLLGNGDGTFQAVVTYDSGGSATNSVAVADMNGDGKPDIVLANQGTGSVSVLLGNGDGTFKSAVTYNAGGPAFSVSVGDLNGDGKPDVVVAGCPAACSPLNSGQLGVLLNNGDGTLQTVVLYDAGGIPSSVTLADVNGDGKLDALAPAGVTRTGTGGFAVLLGNGDGTFQSQVFYSLINGDENGTNNLAVADLNGDGKPDAVLGDRSEGMAVLLGNGDGTFQPEIIFRAANFQGSVAVADLNGGGAPDVALATGGTTVDIFLNTSTTAILSPTTLKFSPQAPGTSSASQSVMLTNIGTAALTVSGISISGTDATGFSQTNNCPSTLAANASCQIKVTSNPQVGGAQTASLNVSDNLPGSPQTATLTGTGQSFSLAASPSTTTVTPGQAGNYTLTVSPLNGFAQKIVFSCSGAPSNSTCTVTPSSVTLSGSASPTANVAVVTAGTSASLGHFYGFPSARSSLGLWLAWPGLLGVVLLSGRSSGSRKRLAWLLRGCGFLGILSLALTWPACGGGSSSSQTPSGTYSVVLAGTYTSGTVTVTQKVKVTLVVQ